MVVRDTASKRNETHTGKSGTLGKWSVTMKLISNWRKAHKMSSMQLNAIALMCDGAFIGLAVS